MTLIYKDIITNFPDEVKSEAPRLLKLNRTKMTRLGKYLSELYSNSLYTDWEKKFFSVVCYHLVGERIEKNIKRLKRYRYFISKEAAARSGKAPAPVRERLDVEGAREIPIENLYDFGRMKNAHSRIHTSCPFHQEKIPSFVIYKNTNSFHCFSCQKGGDNIKFIMELNGVEFLDAVKFILGV